MGPNHATLNRPAHVELVVEGFTGTGLDGFVCARLWIDHQARQLVTFSLSDLDKRRLAAEGGRDLDRVWSTAMTEMTTRLQAEIEYTGVVSRYPDPVIVNSHLTSASPVALDPTFSQVTEAGTLLAQFDL